MHTKYRSHLSSNTFFCLKINVPVHFRLAPAAAAAASANPYLQSMYAAAAAASNPYAIQQGNTAGLISLAQNPFAAQVSATQGSTGNPLLDAYGQYAALQAAGGYTTSAGTPGLTTTIDASASK